MFVLVGVVVLLVNLGFLDRMWLAYWPVVLIILALKELLQNK